MPSCLYPREGAGHDAWVVCFHLGMAGRSADEWRGNDEADAKHFEEGS